MELRLIVSGEIHEQQLGFKTFLGKRVFPKLSATDLCRCNLGILVSFSNRAGLFWKLKSTELGIDLPTSD